MKAVLLFGFVAVAFSLLSAVSHGEPPAPQDPQVKEAEIQESLAKLSPADRKLAESQKFCAILTKNRLGVMGTPIKVMIQDKPVFLCCRGCQSKAIANPEKTLASVAGLVKANAKPEAVQK